MKKKVGVVVVIGVMLLGTSTLAGINAPFLEGAKEEYGEEIALSMEFLPPMIKEDDKYAVIESGNDMTCMMNEGFPLLPYKTEVITFPFGTKIEGIEVITSDVNVMQLDKKIKPAPRPIPANMKSTQVEIKEGEIYSSSEPYPSDWCTYNIGTGIDGDEHVIFLSIHAYPCRYIPASNELLYTNEMNIKVSYESPEKPLLQNDEYDLVIIAPSDFSDALQPLVQHKENHGLKTKSVTLNEIYGGTYFTSQGRDDAEKVKYFIKNAIEEWGTKYVLLVGGRHGGIGEPKWWFPVRYTNLDDESDESSFLSDLYFADIYRYDDGIINFDDWDSNGNGIYAEWWASGTDILDLYPDVYVGRLACRNAFEVDIMVEKIVTYETTTYGQQWFKKFVGIAGDTFIYENDSYYEGELGVSVATGYLEAVGFETAKLFTSTDTLRGADDIISATSQGCGLLDFEGHGNPMSWATHPPYDDETWIGIDESQFIQLKNEGMYPVCMIGGCHNSRFDISLLNLLDFKNLFYTYYHSAWGPECFSWWLTRKIDGGAIATIGCSGYGYGMVGDEDNDSIPDATQYLGGFIDSEFFRVYAQEGKDILGETHATAITSYLTKFPIDWSAEIGSDLQIDCKTVEEWVLLGDPSLKIGGYP